MTINEIFEQNNHKVTQEIIDGVRSSRFYQKFGRAIYVCPDPDYPETDETIVVDIEGVGCRPAYQNWSREQRNQGFNVWPAYTFSSYAPPEWAKRREV